ncbi:hypothetical protein [Xylophilus sp. GOD-11R]|uniref:hypothetical protein n=1 Tax=Xylophilus sp. GOD-11R TaxID=3089814 RepID=UPI00298CDBE0|nr:hypothetical protein [Xylophilus sp. GOD-11R]WPB58866.1 hypothetical protein R9X41_09600 [Xylophilus sp. GOD-11R]
MSSAAARHAYTMWVIADVRYRTARADPRVATARGEEKERWANLLADLAKRRKDAWDVYTRASSEL